MEYKSSGFENIYICSWHYMRTWGRQIQLHTFMLCLSGKVRGMYGKWMVLEESRWKIKSFFLTTYTKCSIYKQVSFWEIIHNQIHSSVLQNESYTPWSQIYNVYWFVLPSNAFTSPPLLLLLLNTRALIEHYIMVYFHTVP